MRWGALLGLGRGGVGEFIGGLRGANTAGDRREECRRIGRGHGIARKGRRKKKEGKRRATCPLTCGAHLSACERKRKRGGAKGYRAGAGLGRGKRKEKEERGGPGGLATCWAASGEKFPGSLSLFFYSKQF